MVQIGGYSLHDILSLCVYEREIYLSQIHKVIKDRLDNLEKRQKL